MVSLRLSASLAPLLPDGTGPSSRRTVMMDASCWVELTEQIRDRFPDLAKRVLNGGAEVAPGFVLVVNDEVMRRPPASLTLAAGDEVTIFAAVAGGA
jgi:molybdopterin converting factor small subunit